MRKLDHAPGLIAVAMILGCEAISPLPPDAVARIDESLVRYSDFEAFLRDQAGEDAGALASDVLSGLFDQFLDELLVARVAVERRVVGPEAEPWWALELLLAAELGEQPVSEAEVADYYRQHESEFVRPERVELRQILAPDLEAAEEALARIAKGSSFAEVAQALSTDPSAERGGDQGELARRDLPSAFADVIFELGEGEVSQIYAAAYGYHIFQVVRRLPEELLPLDEAAPVIRVDLERRRADRVLERLVSQAREDYSVQVFSQNLPFDYGGRFGIDPPG